jgi:hypothetical protein
MSKIGERCCDDIAVHCHDGLSYKDGRRYEWKVRFEWRRPRAVVVHTANRAPWVRLNRYPGVVIGAAFKLGARRQLSILWGRPGAPYEIPVERSHHDA